MTHYPDSIEGVRALLKDLSDAEPSTFKADPYIAGCWLVHLVSGDALLVYVGNHAFAPDFEEVI